MAETSILQGLQLDIADRLLAEPYFSNVPVLSENLMDIDSQIEIAIAQLGVVVVVVTPTASVRKDQDYPGPYFEQINLVIQVSENVILNRGGDGIGKTCLEVAEHALAVLHGYRPQGIAETIFANNPTINLVNDPNGLLTYHVNLQTQGGLRFDIPVLATPTITAVGSTAELACATPNGQMFYTLNGKPPTPRNGTFYTGPVTVASGQTIKVRAWLAGYVTSLLASSTFP